MNDREKLVKLIQAAVDGCAEYWAGLIADHLLANGVTFSTANSKWIPVSERYPDLIPCNAGTAYSEAVIVWTTGKKAMIAVWDGIDFICSADFWDAFGETITHWMPLPEPPKGE